MIAIIYEYLAASLSHASMLLLDILLNIVHTK